MSIALVEDVIYQREVHPRLSQGRKLAAMFLAESGMIFFVVLTVSTLNDVTGHWRSVLTGAVLIASALVLGAAVHTVNGWKALSGSGKTRRL
jgi:hypothetical protein